MSLDKCSTCKDFTFASKSHVCKPAWDCWNECSTEDDARRVFADDEKEAVEKFAADDDARYAEYSTERDVFVRAHATAGAAKTFHVWLESVPSYSAREVKV